MAEIGALDVILRASTDQFNTALASAQVGLAKTEQGSIKVAVAMDNASKSMAKVASQSAATTGGISNIAKSVDNATVSLKNVSVGFDAMEQSVDAIAAEFDAKWNPIVQSILDAAEAGRIADNGLTNLQNTVAKFGGGVVKFDTAQINKAITEVDKLSVSLTKLPVAKVDFVITGDTQTALAGFAGLSNEIKELSTDGVASISKLNSALGTLRTASVQATDPTSFARYNAAIEKVESEITRFKTVSASASTSLGGFNKASNTATFAVTNLGRVLQDLPFGFIGISNNLNPLLESFQRLQKESKNTGTSLVKNLLGSLAGGGGIGLALSGVTAALTIASYGLSAWTRGFGSNKKAVEETTKVTNEYAEAIKKAQQEVSGEASRVEQIIEVLKRETISREQRKKAIEELKQISPEYFKQLDIEKSSIDNLTIAYAAYIKNLVAAVKSKAAENQLESLNNKLVQTSNKIDEINQRFANTQTFGGIANQKEIQSILDKSLKTYEDIRKLSQLTGKSETFIKENLTARNSALVEQTRILGKIQELMGDIGIKDLLKNLGISDETKKDVETISDILAKLKLQIAGLNAIELNLGIDESTEKLKDFEQAIEKIAKTTDTLQNKLKAIEQVSDEIEIVKGDPSEKIKALENAVKSLISLRVDPNDTIVQKIFGEINEIQLQQTFKSFSDFIKKNFGEKITAPIDFTVKPDIFIDSPEGSKRAELIAKVEKLFKDFHLKIPVNINFESDVNLSNLERKLSDIKKKLNDEFNDIIQNFNNALFDSIGQGIGDALSGKGFQGVFSGIFSALSGAMKSLGQTLIETGVALLAFKAAFKSLNPVVAIGAGIALEAFATLLQNKISSIPKFAQGGIVPLGFPNDTFPAFLSSGEIVLNEAQQRALQKPPQIHTVNVTGQFELRGDVLRALIKRSDIKARRTN